MKLKDRVLQALNRALLRENTTLDNELFKTLMEHAPGKRKRKIRRAYAHGPGSIGEHDAAVRARLGDA